MSRKNNWCEEGSSSHPECKSGYVYFSSGHHYDDAINIVKAGGYKKFEIGATSYDVDGNITESYPIFVSKQEWRGKKLFAKISFMLKNVKKCAFFEKKIHFAWDQVGKKNLFEKECFSLGMLR